MQRRYLKADRREKGRLLAEVLAVSGYSRRHLLRLLRHGQLPDPRRATVQGQPIAGLETLRRRLPMPRLDLDLDNGSAFLNAT